MRGEAGDLGVKMSGVSWAGKLGAARRAAKRAASSQCFTKFSAMGFLLE